MGAVHPPQHSEEGFRMLLLRCDGDCGSLTRRLTQQRQMEDGDDDTVCLGESSFFFVNREYFSLHPCSSLRLILCLVPRKPSFSRCSYELTTFSFGSHSLDLLCLRSASSKCHISCLFFLPSLCKRMLTYTFRSISSCNTQSYLFYSVFN